MTRNMSPAFKKAKSETTIPAMDPTAKINYGMPITSMLLVEIIPVKVKPKAGAAPVRRPKRGGITVNGGQRLICTSKGKSAYCRNVKEWMADSEKTVKEWGSIPEKAARIKKIKSVIEPGDKAHAQAHGVTTAQGDPMICTAGPDASSYLYDMNEWIEDSAKHVQAHGDKKVVAVTEPEPKKIEREPKVLEPEYAPDRWAGRACVNARDWFSRRAQRVKADVKPMFI